MAVLSMKFQNWSGVEFHRDYHGYLYQKALSGPGILPGTTLKARTGGQNMNIDQMLTFVDQGPLEIFCCWRSPDGFRFGVKLHANFQMFGLGYRPNWFVMADNGHANSHPNWIKSGDDPASPHEWKNAPFKISATPDSGHMSLSVNILIQDKK